MKRLWAIISATWGQLVVAAIALASVRVYTELLTPAEFGYAMLAQGIIALLEGATLLAFSQSVVTLCGRLRDSELRATLSIDLAWHFVRKAAIATMAVAVLATIAWVLFAPGPIAIIVPFLILTFVTTESFKYAYQGNLLLELRYTKLSCWYSVEAALVIATTVGLLVAVQDGVAAFIAGYFIGRIVSSLLFFSADVGNIWLRRTARLPTATSLDAWRFGRNVAAMGPLGWVSSYLDRYILGASLSASATGIYVATSGVAVRPFNLFSSVLTNYFRPRFHIQDADQARSNTFEQTLKRWIATSLAIGLLSIAMAAVAGKALTDLLLAPDYRANAPTILLLLCIAQTFTISTHAADNAILARGRSGLLLKTQAALAIGTLVLIPLGALTAGLLGAVMGRALAELTKLAAALAVARHTIRTLDKAEK